MEITYIQFLPGINNRVQARCRAKIGPFFISNIKLIQKRQGLTVHFPTNFRPDLTERLAIQEEILAKYRTIKKATKDFEKVRVF